MFSVAYERVRISKMLKIDFSIIIALIYLESNS